jgi:anti-sigma factor RsiW
MSAPQGETTPSFPIPTCEEVLTFLWAYLDGELEEAKRQAFDYHLSRCQSCTAYLETYKATIELEKAIDTDPLTVDDLPEDLIQAVLAAARSPHG